MRSGTCNRTLNEEESKIGRALAGGHIPSVAKAVIQHSALRDEVFLQFCNLVNNECSKLCQRRNQSTFRKLPVSDYVAFQWEQFIDELRSKAPTLLQLFRTISSPNDHRNKHKSGSAHYPSIVMATAILLKERNKEMCGVQSLISLLLFASHADKQVYSELLNSLIHVCMGYHNNDY